MKKKRRSDGYFQASATVDGGRKFFYSRVSQADAERKKDAFLTRHAAEKLFGVHAAEKITFGKWAEQWLALKEEKVKRNTFETTYKAMLDRYILPEFAAVYLGDIKPLDIDRFYAKKANLSQSTLQKIAICFNGVFDSAVDNDILPKNPAKNAKPKSKKVKKEKRTYSQEQVDEIIQFCEIDKDGLPIRLLLECGLRDSELCGLRWDDIDLSERVLRVERAVTDTHGVAIIGAPKSKTSRRIVPFSSAMRDFLAARKSTGYVLKKQGGKETPLAPRNFASKRYNSFWLRFTEWRKDNGTDGEFERLTPHELRHTCGTLLYNRCQNIYAVSRFLGHSSVDVTARIYVHNDRDVLRQSLMID